MTERVNDAGEQPGAPPYLVTDALRQRLDLAHHLIGYGRQILVVSGAPESGRSTFLGQVVAEAPEDWVIVRCNGIDLPEPVDLLRAIADGLDPRAAEHEQPYAEGDIGGLRAFLRGRLNLLHAERRRAVLVCDDCDGWQQDHADLLAELAYRHDEVGELRPLVACREDGAFATILAASTVTNLPQVIDLPPLAADEALALVELVASASADALGEDDLMAELDAAAGRPGAFLRGVAGRSGTEAGVAAPAGRRLRMLAGVALVVAVACGLLVIAWIEQRKPGATPELIELEVPQRPAPVAAPAVTIDPVPEPVAREAPQAPVEGAPASGGPASAGALPAATTTSPADMAHTEPVAPTVATENPATPAKQQPAEAIEVVAERPAGPAPEPVAEVREDAPEPEPAAPRSGDDQLSDNGYTRKWVLTYPDDHYVLQLFGSREQAAARRFIAAHQLETLAAVFELEHDGAPWFVAVTGMYPARDAARAAIDGLPAPLRTTGAWPRQVATLRK